ncbi:hypothetical protein BDF19DRAFT_414245 [Syncephalis fuscata]|nr:hypothetical protein BDF19DRAFT_414245 [Syncephalis fuscata]
MTDRQVTVTYADPTKVWSRVENEFKKLFPLRNLSWLSLREQQRVIDSLGVQLEPFEQVTPPVAIPVSLSSRPFLNILFVQGEDLEVYRQTLRQRIKDWLDIIATRKPQEWLIVHVTEQEARTNTSKYLMMKTTVYDKIRTDFNTRRDRCIQIRITETHSDATWQELANKMKEGIMGSFRQHVIYNEDDVRRLDAQRQMPGWNYCTFFLMKENMAQTYEMLGLYDEALMQYDELEASYFLIERENALAWFSSFGGRDPGDDSADIFDSTRKPYRTLIQDNAISLFDLQIYMFARQSELLRQLNRAQEICNRAGEFINSMLRIIRQFRESLPDNFEEYWVFSSCTRAVFKYYELVGEQGVDVSARKSIISLYYLARKQVIGSIGYPLWITTKQTALLIEMDQLTSGEPKTIAHMLDTITNAELAEIFRSAEDFDHRYLALTENIADGYEQLKQLQMAWSLQSDIASLNLYRGRAFKPLQYSMICLYHLTTNMIQLFTYAQLCLKLLQKQDTLDAEDLKVFTDDFIQYARKLNDDTQPLAPMFKLTLLDKTDDVQILGIEISLDSSLTLDFSYDKVVLDLTGEEEKSLQLVTGEGVLTPGLNRLTVYCDHAETGDYTVKKLAMTIGNLVFSENFEDSSKRKTYRISAPESSLFATLSLALSENAEATPRFRVQMHTRKHAIVKGQVSLLITTEGANFPEVDSIDIKKIIDETGSEEHVEMTPELNNSLEMVCPLPVKLVVAYTTQQDQIFSFSVLESLDFSMPIAMRPMIYPLEKHTLVKVDIICDGIVPVRLLSCESTLSENIRLLDEPPISACESVLFAQSRTALTYRLEQDYSKEEATMSLQVRFRLLSDEAAIHVNALLERTLEETGLSQYKWLVIEHTKSLLENSVVDLNAIGLIDAISTEHLNASSYASLFVHESEALQRRLNHTLTEFFQTHQQIPIDRAILDAAEGMERLLFCTITLPTRQLITTAELIPDCRELVIEESCPCRVVINQSQLYQVDAESADAPISSELGFDLDGGREQWIIAGQKKARFTMEPGQTREFNVTLVPMKTGLYLCQHYDCAIYRQRHVQRLLLMSRMSSIYL